MIDKSKSIKTTLMDLFKSNKIQKRRECKARATGGVTILLGSNRNID